MPIAGGIGLFFGDDARFEEADDVFLAVAGGVFFEPQLDVVLVVDRSVLSSIARSVLLFDALAAIGIEPRPDVPAPIVVFVCFDGNDGPVLVGGDAIGLAVEVGVLLEALGLFTLVGEGRVDLAVGVLVVELGTRFAVFVLDPAIGLSVSGGVLLLAAGFAVALVEDPDVDRAVEIGVLFGSVGFSAGVVDELVELAVFVVVDVLLVDVFVFVVEELDGRAGRVGAGERRGNRGQQREKRRESRRDSGHPVAQPV